MSLEDLQEELPPPNPADLQQNTIPLHKNKKAYLLFFGILVICGIFIWHRIYAAPVHSQAASLPNVVTQSAQTAQVPVYLDALGTVTPTYSVTVKTQINGRLEKIFVKEGQHVKKGDLLAQ